METWFLLAILPPLLWASTNYLDQLLTRQYFSDAPINMLALGGFSNVVVLIPMAILAPDVLDVPAKDILLMLIPGVLYFIGVIPYLYALNEEEASNVVPVFQTGPIFCIGLEYLLGKHIFSLHFMLGAFFIIAGAMIISWNPTTRRVPVRPLLLVLLAAAIFTIYTLVLDANTQHWTWYKVSFWNLLGWVVASFICVLCSKKCRTGIVQAIYRSRGKVILGDFTQQAFDVLAAVFLVLALAKAPSTTHVILVNGLQPFFLLILAVILGQALPQFYPVVATDRYFVLKCLGAGVVFYGLYLVQMT